MVTEKKWMEFKTTPSVFETKLLKVSEVKTNNTILYTGANNTVVVMQAKLTDSKN